MERSNKMFRNILIALAATGAIGLGMTAMTAPADAAWCNPHRCYNHHNGSNFNLRIGVYPGYYRGYRYGYARSYGYYAPGCGYRWVTIKSHHHWVKSKSWVCY
jgi:hypothetical protein